MRHLTLIKKIFALSLCVFCTASNARGATQFDKNTIGAIGLADCIQASLSHAPEIHSATSELAGRQADRESATKDRLPGMSFGYTLRHQFDGASSYSSSNDDYASYSMTLSQPLYQGGALDAGVAKAEIGVRQAELDQETARLKKILDVHLVFHDVLKRQRIEDLAGQAVIRLEAHAKDAKAFYEVGLIPKNDFLASEVELAQGRLELLQARSNTDLARSALNIMMNRAADTPLVLREDETLGAMPLSWQAALLIATDNRLELRQTDLQHEALAQDMILARSPFLPAVTFSTTYLKQGNDLLARELAGGASESQSAQTVATWKLWQWRQQDDRAAAVAAKISKNQAQKNAVADAIAMQVREAFLQMKQAEENIKVTETAVSQAEENFRINEARYQAQLNTSTQVLDAQTLLTRAAVNHANARYDYKIVRARLDWAMGIIGGAGYGEYARQDQQ